VGRRFAVRIVDLAGEHLDSYVVCLEDWSDEMKEAGDHKRCWYERAKQEGLRVKLALDDEGTAGGMVQYGPIEASTAEGKDLYFVYCIWVHGYKEGRGNFRHLGMGKALLEAAEEDVRALGAKGLVAWGISLPFWMKASWFRKHGYRKIDNQGGQILLWKPFRQDAVAPKWIRPRKKPQGTPGRVTVTSFKNGWCPAQNLIYERARRAAATFGDRVIFQAFDTSDRRTFLEWGICDALFIDDKAVRTGPPPSYEKVRRQIEKRLPRP
jgi:GNAT superfamily N-acetyltransferase